MDGPVQLLYLPRGHKVTSADNFATLAGYTARMVAQTLDAASAVWPAANRALYLPVELSAPLTVQRAFWINGATVAGNVDVGIYAANGTRLVSSGSTVMAGASAVQQVAITSTYLPPGRYWLAMASDSATATFNRGAVGSSLLLRVCGVQEQAAAFALPATSTFANPSSDYYPFVGFTTKSAV